MKNNYKVFKNSLREKKRKYIFVNKLTNTNKSIQLKINNNEDNEDNDNYNSIKKLIQSSNTCKNKPTVVLPILGGKLSTNKSNLSSIKS